MTDITCVVACWPGDQDQALRLFNWIAELGRVRAPLLLIASDECDIPQLMRAGGMAFDSVKLEQDHQKIVSDWSAKEPGPKSAAGPNSLWKLAAWYFHLPTLKGPWFFLEPDCIPLTPDWFDVLAAEYRQMGKPFMGALVQGPKQADRHMSGVGFYDPRTPAIMTEAMRSEGVAFDVTDAAKVLGMAHITTRIHDQYRAPSFTSMEEVESRISKEAVLFHANKDGSLIPFIRQKLGMSSGPATVISLSPHMAVTKIPESTVRELHPAPSMAASNGAAKFDPSSAPIVDIYIKTYPKDHEVLNYALKSIAKFVTGFRSVIIQTPRLGGNTQFGQPVIIPESLQDKSVIATTEDKQPGYLWQQAAKLYADKHTDAPFILYWDSDCVFTRPTDVSEFFRDGRPVWLKEPFGTARKDQQVWKPIMEKFVGREAEYELMRRHPFVVKREWLEQLRTFCRYKWAMELEKYIMVQAPPGVENPLVFSEWNCLGHFLHEFLHDQVAWIDTSKEEPPPSCVFQGFTHGGPERTNQDIEKYKEILGLNQSVFTAGKSGLTVDPQIVQSIHEAALRMPLDMALNTLIDEASKSPLHKARLMKRLTASGIIPEKVKKGRKRRVVPA